MRSSNHRVRLLLLALALAVRIGLLSYTVAEDHNGRLRCLSFDSPTYIGPAVGFLRLGSFREHGIAASPPMHSRTPGYPLFLAAHYAVFGVRQMPVLIAQVLLGGAMALVVFELARRWLDSERLARLIGVFACLAPGSVVVSTLLASDLLFYATFLVGLWVFTFGLEKRRRGHLLLAGGIWGSACLVHPRLLLFPPAIVVVGALLARHYKQRVPWRWLLGAAAVFSLFPLGWAARNWARVGLFKVSTTANYNLKYHLAADALQPVWWDAARLRDRWLREDERLFRKGGTIRDVDAKRGRDAWRIIREHPAAALRAYVTSALRYTLAPGALVPHLLPKWPWPRWVTWFRGFLKWLARAETLVGIVGVVFLWRRSRWLALALLVVFAYFVAIAAVGSRQGGRMVLPAEPAYLVFFAAGLCTLWRAARQVFRFGRARGAAEEQS